MPNISKHADVSERDTNAASAAADPPSSLAAFKLEQVTLEIRYPVALELWDRAGAVWRSVQEKWPDVTLIRAEPARTDFRSGKNSFTIELEAARIVASVPDRSLEEFGKDAKMFMAAVMQTLRIDVLKRIGFRLIYFREYQSKEAAASALFSLGLLKVPENRRFEVSETPLLPQYLVRWESEIKGVFLQVRAEGRKLDFDPPPEAAQYIEPVHIEKDGVTFDIDYYTVASVQPSQIDIAEWARHAVHLINRDTKFVFGE